MKKLLILIFILSGTALAQNRFSDRVPGRDYTVREFLLQRALINKLNKTANPPELNGKGMTFYGTVKIRKEQVKQEDGSTKEEKKYKVFIRNCGDIELNKKDEDSMKKLKNGTRVKLNLAGSSCKVTDWVTM